jgi:predicted DNA-binding transcriptional regulator AlpA
MTDVLPIGTAVKTERASRATSAQPAISDGDVLDYEAASAFVGVCVATLQSWVSRKRITHIRLGPRSVVFLRSDLTAWLLAKRKVAVSQ